MTDPIAWLREQALAASREDLEALYEEAASDVVKLKRSHKALLESLKDLSWWIECHAEGGGEVPEDKLRKKALAAIAKAEALGESHE